MCEYLASDKGPYLLNACGVRACWLRAQAVLCVGFAWCVPVVAPHSTNMRITPGHVVYSSLHGGFFNLFLSSESPVP